MTSKQWKGWEAQFWGYRNCITRSIFWCGPKYAWDYVHVCLLLLNHPLLWCLVWGAREGDVCNAAPFLDELLVCTCCKCSWRICGFTLPVSETVDCMYQACSILWLWQHGEKLFLSCLPLLPFQMWNTSWFGECCALALSTCRFDVLTQHLLLLYRLKNQEETECYPDFLGSAKENFHVFLQLNLIWFFLSSIWMYRNGR